MNNFDDYTILNIQQHRDLILDILARYPQQIGISTILRKPTRDKPFTRKEILWELENNPDASFLKYPTAWSLELGSDHPSFFFNRFVKTNKNSAQYLTNN